MAARAGLEKKATGIEIIDVMGKVDYADYLVLMTGASDRNVAAIAQEVDGELAKAGYRSMAIEGLPVAQWVLIDFVDVVVHVFQRDVRSLYDLDGLWMDAARVPVESAQTAQTRPSASFDDVIAPARNREPRKRHPKPAPPSPALPRRARPRLPRESEPAKPVRALARRSAVARRARLRVQVGQLNRRAFGDLSRRPDQGARVPGTV